MDGFPDRIRFKSPFLSDLFSEIRAVRQSTCSKSGLADFELSRDPVLDIQISDTNRKTAQKLSPKRAADLSYSNTPAPAGQVAPRMFF